MGRRFVALFSASALSNLADGILLVGIPLVALTLTTSPFQISLLSTALHLPWLVLALYAGVVIDRGDRRLIMVLAMVVRATVLLVGLALALTDTLTMPLLLVLLLAFGSAEVFADSSAATMIPAVVPRSRLAAANGRLLGAQQVANTFVGAPAAGLLLALGTGWVFGVPVALCTGAVLLMVVGVRGRYRAQDAAPRAAMRSEIRDGLGFLLRHPVMRPLVINSSVFNLASTAYMAVFVLWVVGPSSAIGMSPKHYGLVMTAFAVGAVVGATLAERLARRFPEIRLFAVMWMLNAALMAVPVLLPDMWVLGAVFALVGLTNSIGNVINVGLRQRLVPDRLLGRVGGASRTLAYGTMPVGAVLGGLVAEVLGLRALLLGAVVLLVASTTYVLVTVTPAMVAEAEAEAAPRVEIP